jgi:hypothetical protein
MKPQHVRVIPRLPFGMTAATNRAIRGAVPGFVDYLVVLNCS